MPGFRKFDEYGTIIDQPEYYPFGGLRSGGDPPATTHLFTGHERDLHSGAGTDDQDDLDYMHARYYSFHTARFLSVDPVKGEVGSSQSWNRYSYVMNSPLVLLDRFGLTETEHTRELTEFDREILRQQIEDQRLLQDVVKNCAEINKNIDNILDGIEAAGRDSGGSGASDSATSGFVLSLDVSGFVGAGAKGGGGTALNLGFSDQGDFSISITGTAGVGFETGGGATVGIGIGGSVADSVFDLEGGSSSSGLAGALAGGASGSVVTNEDGTARGGHFSVVMGARGGAVDGLSTFHTTNTTSTIFGWGSREGFVLFSSGG